MAIRPMLFVLDPSRLALCGHDAVLGLNPNARRPTTAITGTFDLRSDPAFAWARGHWYGRMAIPNCSRSQPKDDERACALSWLNEQASYAEIAYGWIAVVEVETSACYEVGILGWAWRLGMDWVAAGEVVSEHFFGTPEIGSPVAFSSAFADAVAYIDSEYGEP